MSFNVLGAVISKVTLWLNENNIKYALVGGLAVSFRTIERATKDIDFAIATKNDKDAERVVRAFQSLGFKPAQLFENKSQNVISTVRLLSDEFSGVYVDLLFSTSGIEKEIVALAEYIEILPGIKAYVASSSSLIAMKVLSSTNKHRRQDLIDLENLIKDVKQEEIDQAKYLIKIIEERGFNQSKKLTALFKKFLKDSA